MPAVVRASSKYQVAIPKAIRDRINLRPGQRLVISEENGVISLVPIPEDPVEYLWGIFEGEPSMAEELLRERQRDLEHE